MGGCNRSHITAGLLAVAVLGCAGVLLTAASANASDPFANPGFENWTQVQPANWQFTGDGFSKASGEGNPGNAVRLTLSGGAPTLAHSLLSVEPGATVDGSFEVSGDANTSVQLRMVYLNGDSFPVLTHFGAPEQVASSFTTVFMSDTAPAGASYVQLTLAFSGPAAAEVLVDNAALVITAPAPTLTPTPTDTPTPSPTPAETATPSPTPLPGETVEPSPTLGGGSGSPAKTPTPTRTPSPTKTPTGTRTPSPTHEPTSTKTPTPPKGATARPTSPLATSTPTVQPGSGFGGLLANGDFELVVEGKPAYWEKFGGTMSADGEAARGTYAACLQSDTSSTKWLYQVVPVESGAWYAASASGRVSGPGFVSIRVSWYASSDAAGSQMAQAESNVSSSSSWTSLATGPVRAPDGANSARVRLVLRPDGPATACFDDATFVGAEPLIDVSDPVETTVPTASAPSQPGGARPPTARATATAHSPTLGAGGATVPSLTFPVDGPGTLRISEFMSDPDPSGRDAAFEWLELVNISDEPVSLEGWKLGDASRQDALPLFTLPAHGYVVVAGPSAELPSGIPVTRVAGGEIGNGLGNDGDYLVLVAPNGDIADEVSYGTNTRTFDPPPPAPAEGGTLGIREPAADPASENWALTSRASPGEPNVFPAKSTSTVAGERTRGPEEAAPLPAATLQSSESGATLGIAWVILMLVGAGSAGAAGVKFGPKLQQRLKGLKSRSH